MPMDWNRPTKEQCQNASLYSMIEAATEYIQTHCDKNGIYTGDVEMLTKCQLLSDEAGQNPLNKLQKDLLEKVFYQQ